MIYTISYKTWLVLIVSLGLYIVAISTRWPLVYSTFNGNLHGEELAAAFGAVVSFEKFEQYDKYQTNFGTYVLFWIASHIPPFDLYYARKTHVILSSSLPALGFLICKYRLNLSIASALCCGILILFNPVLISYSVLLMGLELIPGCLALLLMQFNPLNRKKLRVFLVIFLISMSASFYGAGLIFILPVFWWILRYHDGSVLYRLSRCMIYGSAYIILTMWPYFLIDGNPIPSKGGGHFNPNWSSVSEALVIIGKDLFVWTSSYYNFAYFPAFGAVEIYLFLLLCSMLLVLLALSKLRFSQMHDQAVLLGLMLLWCIAILLFACVSGDYPGIRRGLMLVVLPSFIFAIVLDNIFNYFPATWFKSVLLLMVFLSIGWRGYNVADYLRNAPIGGYDPLVFDRLLEKLGEDDVVLKRGADNVSFYSALKLLCNRRELVCNDILLCNSRVEDCIRMKMK